MYASYLYIIPTKRNKMYVMSQLIMTYQMVPSPIAQGSFQTG